MSINKLPKLFTQLQQNIQQPFVSTPRIFRPNTKTKIITLYKPNININRYQIVNHKIQ